jgi:WhiB family transcriptional regulator, redox-sensing transcriptional regulator
VPRPKPSVKDEVNDLIAWSEDAACKQHDAAAFDTRRVNQHTVLSRANLSALEVCAGCPVAKRCLEHAVKYGKTGAIWGGMTDEERADLELAEAAVAA